MKNLAKILVVLALGIFLLIPSMAMAGLVWSHQDVESFQGSSAVQWKGGYWHGKIAGDTDTSFNITGATLTADGVLKITTGWPGAGNSDLGAVAADLYLGSNSQTWAIRLQSNGLGDVFVNPIMATSVQAYSPLSQQYGYIYGGAYGGPGNAKPTPVLATGTTTYALITDLVTWSTGEVDIDLSKLAYYGFDDTSFSFLYASATCGNSVIIGSKGSYAPVPIPPSVLLLGTGLIGLVGLRWRQRKIKG